MHYSNLSIYFDYINLTCHCVLYCHLLLSNKTWTCSCMFFWDSPSSVIIIRDEEVCILTRFSMYAYNNALINRDISAEMEIRMTLLLEYKCKHKLRYFGTSDCRASAENPPGIEAVLWQRLSTVRRWRDLLNRCEAQRLFYEQWTQERKRKQL